MSGHPLHCGIMEHNAQTREFVYQDHKKCSGLNADPNVLGQVAKQSKYIRLASGNAYGEINLATRV